MVATTSPITPFETYQADMERHASDTLDQALRERGVDPGRVPLETLENLHHHLCEYLFELDATVAWERAE